MAEKHVKRVDLIFEKAKCREILVKIMKMEPDAISQMVLDSDLKGRGRPGGFMRLARLVVVVAVCGALAACGPGADSGQSAQAKARTRATMMGMTSRRRRGGEGPLQHTK